jgi:hypothetical protein
MSAGILVAGLTMRMELAGRGAGEGCLGGPALTAALGPAKQGAEVTLIAAQ